MIPFQHNFKHITMLPKQLFVIFTSVLPFFLWFADWKPPAMAQAVLDEKSAELSPVDSDLNIRANVVIGLDPQEPFRRMRAWVPIRIELNNLDDDFTGNLIVQLKDGQIVYRTPVDLPARAKQLYTIYVFLPETLDELEFYLQTGGRKIDFEVITVSTPAVESTRFIALLSSERGTHEHLAHREEDDRAEIFREVVYTSSIYLPKSWVGMQNIDTLIWDGNDNLVLTPEQEKALDQWIQMGGTLVLACGERWQMLNSSALRLYSPVTMDGSIVLPAKQNLSTVNENSDPVLLPSVVAATGELLDDPKINVRIKAGDHPFLVERPWGAGKVVWVASSLREPLFEPVYQEIFLTYLASNNLSFTPLMIDNLDAAITSFLRWMVQAELPSTGFVAMYLGLYIIILVPVNYLVFRSIKRLEWAWFTIPVWAVIFAYGAYYIGSFSQHSEVIANQISLLESKPDAKYARSTTFCSVYSPIRKWYTIRFEEPKAFPMAAWENMFRPQTMASDNSMAVSFHPRANQIDDFLIYHWSQRSFKAQHTLPIGDGVSMNIRFRDNELEGGITNNTPFPLTGTRLYLKERMIHLSNMQPGETVRLDGKWRNAQRLELYNTWQMSPRRMNYGRDNRDMSLFIRDRLAEGFAQYYFQSPATQGMAVFVAHADVSALDFMLGDNVIHPNGEALLTTSSTIEELMLGTHTLQPDDWQINQTAFGAYGYGGFRGRFGSNNQFMQVEPNSEVRSEIITELPLEYGRINWLRLEFNPKRIENHRTGRRPQTMNNQPLQAETGMYVRDRLSRRYIKIDEITDANGYVENPDQYVDKIAGSITVKYTNRDAQHKVIPREAFQISMEMDYGNEGDDSFLGYSLELARLEYEE